MSRIWTIAAFLVACGDGGVADTAQDEPAGGPKCGNNLLESHPGDGASEVYYRTVIDYRFADEDPTASISLTGPDGAPVEGTQGSKGSRSWFQPQVPLEAGGAYTATLDWMCGTETAQFAVGSDPGAAVDAATVVDSSYVLDLRQARFVEPEGIGQVLTSMIQFNLLIGFTGVEGTALSMLGAVADANNQQDLCAPSIPFEQTADFAASPYFEVQADVLPIVVAGSTLTIEDMVMSGAFSGDLSSIEGASLSGIVDTRALSGSLGSEGDPGSVCQLFYDTFRITCEECPSGEGPYCVNLVLDTMSAPSSGQALQVWTEADVAKQECGTE